MYVLYKYYNYYNMQLDYRILCVIVFAIYVCFKC